MRTPKVEQDGCALHMSHTMVVLRHQVAVGKATNDRRAGDETTTRLCRNANIEELPHDPHAMHSQRPASTLVLRPDRTYAIAVQIGALSSVHSFN